MTSRKKNIIKRFIEKVIETISPSNLTCVVCNGEIEENTYICESCQLKLPYITSGYCIVCGTYIGYDGKCNICKETDRYFDEAHSVFMYKDEIPKLIYRFKNNSEGYLAEYFAHELQPMIWEQQLTFDLITYVPITKKKYRKRGYNQAYLMAEILAKELDVPLMNNVIKIKDTKEQKTLNRAEREHNLSGVFSVNERLDGKRVLVIDDVMTTGSTINELSKVLKSQGASVVYVATVASTVRLKAIKDVE